MLILVCLCIVILSKLLNLQNIYLANNKKKDKICQQLSEHKPDTRQPYVTELCRQHLDMNEQNVL